GGLVGALIRAEAEGGEVAVRQGRGRELREADRLAAVHREPARQTQARAGERRGLGLASHVGAEDLPTAVLTARHRQRLELAWRHKCPAVGEQSAGVEARKVSLMQADAEEPDVAAAEVADRQRRERAGRDRREAADKVALGIEARRENLLADAGGADAEEN